MRQDERKEKKEEEEENRTGPAPLGGSCQRGKVALPWEAPSPVGRAAGTERELQRLGGQRNSQFAADKTETCTEDLCYLVQSSAQDVCLLVCAGAETWDSNDRPGRGLGLVARRQPEGAGVWYGPNVGCAQKKSRLTIEMKHQC